MPLVTVLYGVFQHPVETEYPRVQIGTREPKGTYGQWKTVNLWRDPEKWVEENLDIGIFITVVGTMLHTEVFAFIGWLGYSFYTYVMTSALPSLNNLAGSIVGT